MILLIDNYDSFVYNLDRYLQRLGQRTLVIRSDAMSVDAIAKLHVEAIVISPGPKTPDEAGCSMEVIRKLGSRIPILGVCLGHQAIGQAYGGQVVRAPQPMHGKSSLVLHDNSLLFRSIPSPFAVARYHSLVIEPTTIPDCLQVTSWVANDTIPNKALIMSVQHREHPVYGVQFHPESILTDHGYQVLGNFLTIHGIKTEPTPAPDVATQAMRTIKP